MKMIKLAAEKAKKDDPKTIGGKYKKLISGGYGHGKQIAAVAGSILAPTIAGAAVLGAGHKAYRTLDNMQNAEQVRSGAFWRQRYANLAARK
jgi:hypothetical protein